MHKRLATSVLKKGAALVNVEIALHKKQWRKIIKDLAKYLPKIT